MNVYSMYKVYVYTRDLDELVEVFNMFVKRDDDPDYKANKLMRLYWPSDSYWCRHEYTNTVAGKNCNYADMESV